MQAFLVKTKIYAPYPIEKEQTVRATSAPPAAARALRNAIAEVMHKRRITNYSLTIARL